MSTKLGMRIRERRKALGLSGDELAKKIGKTRSTIYRYECGDIENLPIELLIPLADALQTSPEYIMGWDNDREDTSKKMDVTLDVLNRMEVDKSFANLLFKLNKLDTNKIKIVETLLDAAQLLGGEADK